MFPSLTMATQNARITSLCVGDLDGVCARNESGRLAAAMWNPWK